MRLDRLQKALTTAVLGAACEDLSSILKVPEGDPLARLNIHRNNIRLSLTAALAANFPVTEALLGQAYFRQAARRFVANHPPREPRLSRYGAGFPRYLAQLDDCRRLPFVSRVALLERAIIDAGDEPVATSVPIAALTTSGDAPAARLHLQPSLRLLTLRYNAAAIWHAHRGNGDLTASLGKAGHHHIQVSRNAGGIAVAELPAARFRFRRALRAGSSLLEAAATSFDNSAELSDELGNLFGEGLVVGEHRR